MLSWAPWRPALLPLARTGSSAGGGVLGLLRALSTAAAGCGPAPPLPCATAAGAAKLEPWPSAALPIQVASTPPSSWYTQPAALQLEKERVFGRAWLLAAHAHQVAAPGQYVAGEQYGLRYVVCRDEAGQLRAFHNVCRHHAAPVAQGSGQGSCFVCCYHGWTYRLDGRLLKAPRLGGIENFRAAEHGLVPLHVDSWGPFVFVSAAPAPAGAALAAAAATTTAASAATTIAAAVPAAAGEGSGASSGDAGAPASWTSPGSEQQAAGGSSGGGAVAEWPGTEASVQQAAGGSSGGGVAEWLGTEGSAAALGSGLCDPLVHVATREYRLPCNWKVFCDNFLDGGYHVSVAHPALAAGLDLPTYTSTASGRLSIQSCLPAAGEERLAGGRPAAYVFVYPNLMINRYGEWLDTNLVTPLSPDSCRVRFDYYLTSERAGDKAFVGASLAASDAVQQEDVALCEGVQAGLESTAYDAGRYAPRVEGPMFHFHRLLHADLMGCGSPR